ncbi:MAG: imidazolonepropionase [Flavobacteriales bacterium]|nr:imidazolonepropionase [Flavobacteriales bacterium]
MSNIIITNIKELVGILPKNKLVLGGKEMNELSILKNAFVEVQEDKIQSFGSMNDLKLKDSQNIFNANGGSVLQSWNDSHTHLVFAKSREKEFIDKINGLSYEQIAKKGGGILNSALHLEKISEKTLFENSKQRLKNIIKLGTGAIEIKSGYGLSLEGELKILRTIKRLKETFNIEIKSTFLGAHALPKKYKNNREKYVDLIINEMLPNIHKERLADYIDVFCETNYFNVDELDRILDAGAKYNLKPKVHVNQFTSIGGIQKAVEHKAISVDHLEIMEENDYDSLRNSSTVATLLPSCSFFIDIAYAPARKLIDKNIPFALASDLNPGSSPNGNMNLVNSLACIKMKILPETVINASTINGAYAMEISNLTGSITVGKQANLILTKPIESYPYLFYSFGENCIERTMVKGKWNK